MFDHVQTKPWTLFNAARQSANLHVQIHGCVVPVELPSQRDCPTDMNKPTTTGAGKTLRVGQEPTASPISGSIRANSFNVRRCTLPVSPLGRAGRNRMRSGVL